MASKISVSWRKCGKSFVGSLRKKNGGTPLRFCHIYIPSNRSQANQTHKYHSPAPVLVAGVWGLQSSPHKKNSLGMPNLSGGTQCLLAQTAVVAKLCFAFGSCHRLFFEAYAASNSAQGHQPLTKVSLRPRGESKQSMEEQVP